MRFLRTEVAVQKLPFGQGMRHNANERQPRMNAEREDYP
jgi:hypothetical protein